jgi:LmbE family N-acetylglucosaminyl deacetylase
MKLLQSYSNVDLLWVVFSADERRKKEALKSASLLLEKALNKEIRIHNFRDSFFPYQGSDIKEVFEDMKAFNPDLIFTHQNSDLHQDHNKISKLTYNTFRNHLILEYEIPKYDGDLGSPNIFSPIDQKLCKQKIESIIDCFKSQKTHQWFSDSTFKAILRLRGIEANSPTGYAEAFYCRKIVINNN